tara:strand:+ start:3037 stop:3630 length:594 start_codon:yes stop_codon:yes gene_type:complete
MPDQKLLVMGYGRHGKDTVCEILRDRHGYRFISSSRFVFEECIWNSMWCARYPDKESCYDDRGNNREQWFNMIAEYNTPDKSRTVTGMFAKGYSIYCGLRSRDEFNATRHLFDKIIWVDRADHIPPEPQSSMELHSLDATHILDNNGTLQDLERAVAKLATLGEHTVTLPTYNGMPPLSPPHKPKPKEKPDALQEKL